MNWLSSRVPSNIEPPWVRRNCCKGALLLWGLCAAIFLLSTVQATAADRNAPLPEWKIFVTKQRQVLDLYRLGAKVKTYRVCLGLNPTGPKRITGDKKTPEGDYFICYKSTASRFCRFLGLSYPGVDDAQEAFQDGLINDEKRDSIINSILNGQSPPWDTKLGGWVGIHGYPTDDYLYRWSLLLFPKPHNWTDGCIALWNFEIEELYSLVPLGTPVRIMP